MQLLRTFRKQIASNELNPGDKLPSERELCEIFDVSRITVRRAISEAESEGLIERVPGLGAFVATPTYQQSLREVKSFAATMVESGLVASTEVLFTKNMFSDFSLAKVLNLSPGSPVRFLRLRGVGNAIPRVVYDSYFAEEFGAKMAGKAHDLAADEKAFTTLDLYRGDGRSDTIRLEQTFEAILADTELSEMLQVKQGWPIFQVESVIYSVDQPLEYRVARYRGDQYKFALERSIDLKNSP